MYILFVCEFAVMDFYLFDKNTCSYTLVVRRFHFKNFIVLYAIEVSFKKVLTSPAFLDKNNVSAR